VKQAYNVAISQVVPILYISNTDNAAYEEVQILINVMTANGFNKVRLINNITQFLSRSTFPGIRVDIQKIISSISL
jgi:spore germination protein YaaH